MSLFRNYLERLLQANTDADTAQSGASVPTPAGAPTPGQILSATDDPLTTDWITPPKPDSISCLLFTDAYASGALGDLTPAQVMAGRRASVTLHCGPNVLGAGQTAAALAVLPAVSGTLQYLELHVSNAAGTQWAVFYSKQSFITFVAGTTRNIVLNDWNLAANHIVGSDLSFNASGQVISTAGGVYWATAIFELLP